MIIKPATLYRDLTPQKKAVASRMIYDFIRSPQGQFIIKDSGLTPDQMMDGVIDLIDEGLLKPGIIKDDKGDPVAWRMLFYDPIEKEYR